MNEIYGQVSQSITHLNLIMLGLTILVHLMFAAGVAKDVGNFHTQKIMPKIVPGMVWVLATAIGGVWVALIYWLIHHSSLSR
ncbi:hypothetical protein N8865_00580 [Francisellaceae bacterium]|nr:hypothetical protein [Francisellaceae bacterium]